MMPSSKYLSIFAYALIQEVTYAQKLKIGLVFKIKKPALPVKTPKKIEYYDDIFHATTSSPKFLQVLKFQGGGY